jgi:ubiquitin-conjugating enzyme E2 H
MTEVTRSIPARVRRDFADVKKNPLANAELAEEEGLIVIRANVVGPPDTPYAGRLFRAQAMLPHAYPFKSPSVGFLTQVWHPNIDFASGSVCLDVLNDDMWSMATNLAIVFEVLLPQLLASPETDSPLNPTAAAELVKNPAVFRATAEAEARKRATPVPDAALLSPSGAS